MSGSSSYDLIESRFSQRICIDIKIGQLPWSWIIVKPESTEVLKFGLQSGDWILGKSEQDHSQPEHSKFDYNPEIRSW